MGRGRVIKMSGKNSLWDKCVEFHGHACPGLAYGVRASETALACLGIGRARDEEMLAIVENDSCSVDAIQVITGCTFGKGNLIFKDRGKQAYTFVRRSSGQAVRIVMNRVNAAQFNEDREAKIKYILEAHEKEVCTIQNVTIRIPEKARIFKNARCEKCGEIFMEPRGRVQDGKIVCLDCFEDYVR